MHPLRVLLYASLVIAIAVAWGFGAALHHAGVPRPATITLAVIAFIAFMVPWVGVFWWAVRRAGDLDELTERARSVAEKQAGGSPCQAVREVVRTRLQELDDRMREIRRYRKELAATLKEWDEAGEIEGHICGLIESTNIKHHPSGSTTSGTVRKSRRLPRR